jgi:hypothetical protein
VAVGADRVVAAPTAGGAPRAWPRPDGVDRVGGVASGGGAWIAFRGGGKDAVVLARQDGTTTPLLAPGGDGPDGIDRLWPAAGGRWFLLGYQFVSDGQVHPALWRLDGNGGGARLACAPTFRDGARGAAAVAPDAVYVALSWSDAGGHRRWEIARVAAPP